jgi:hypothetical protein
MLEHSVQSKCGTALLEAKLRTKSRAKPEAQSRANPGADKEFRQGGSKLFVIVLLAASFARFGLGQAVPTASRKYGLAAFATGGTGNTDYGTIDNAFAFGSDVAFYPHFLFGLEPAAEVRVTFLPSNNIGERTITGGARLGKGVGRLHIYGDFLAGYGVILFPGTHDPNYTRDNSKIFDIGGGGEFDLYGPFALKVDYQEQSWKLGNANSRLTPTLFTVGVKYTIPPRAFRSER